MEICPVKPRTCKPCGNKFTPISNHHRACSTDCALELVRIKQKQAYKKKTNQLKRQFKLKDINYWKQKATQACHQYIRARDGNYCLACCDRSGRQSHASHFRSRGAASQLKFHWANVNVTCAKCNTYLSGNLVKYRENLITKTSPEIVEYLENENSVYKWTIEDYQGVVWWFKQQLEALQGP